MSFQVHSQDFIARSRDALADAPLQSALGKLRMGLSVRRREAVAALPEFEALREEAAALRDYTLATLDRQLETFEAQVRARGGEVHWAPDAASARAIILELCQRYGAKKVLKGKSMVTEELELNEHLEAHGLRCVETDLGEYIVQLRRERPSHIVAPAIHLRKEDVAESFAAHHVGREHADRSTAEALMAEAREELRAHFLSAEVGITGANFAIAETGSTVIVTNEGNGDLTQSLPKVHIAVTGIEKVVPTLEDASTLLRVLARSATGQEASVYTTFSTGPRRPEDPDGPEAYHVVLVDNGRSAMLGTEFEAMLRCIRCGACLNHCPVYGQVGGHAYGSVYPGPMGAVLTPQLAGLDDTVHLPTASTFCGACEAVCPVKIPLPSLLRRWRQRAYDARLDGDRARWLLRLWAFFAARPRLYHPLLSAATMVLGWLAGPGGSFRRLLGGKAWTESRNFPAPEGGSFLAGLQGEEFAPTPRKARSR